MSAYPLPVRLILISDRTPTLKDDQTRFEPWVGLLDLFDLRLQSSPDILGNGRAIDLGSRHSASSAVGCTIDKILQWWWWMGPEEQRGTTTMGPDPTRSSSDPLRVEDGRAGRR